MANTADHNSALLKSRDICPEIQGELKLQLEQNISHRATKMLRLNFKTTKPVTKAEVSKHNNPTDLWLMVNNVVYDLTEFQDDHPGGAKSLSFLE